MSAGDPAAGLLDLMDITLVGKADAIAAEAYAGRRGVRGEPLIELARGAALRERSGWKRAVALLADVVGGDTGWTELDLMAAGMPREVVDAVTSSHPDTDSDADTS